MQLSDDLKATLETAVEEARARRHEYLTLEHLLYALCADPLGRKILKGIGVSIDRLMGELEDFFSEHLELVAEELDETADEPREPSQTLAFWRVFQRAAMHVQGSGKGVIDAGDVLAALFRESESHAVYLLEKQKVSRLDIVKYISHGLGGGTGRGDGRSKSSLTRAEPPQERYAGVDDEDEVEDPLEAFTVNLNERAESGGIDPLVGREKELGQVIQALARRRKNNPVLVGESGVGKTAIIEGLALAIVNEKVPPLLAEAEIFSLDMGSLLAGTKFRGEFEERIKGVVNALLDNENAILFIDEIHTIVGAGATSGGSMDASNLLKPALATGKLRCIGSTTHKEYKSSFERDRALARRFQKIEIDEPSVDDTKEILQGLKTYYEDHHEVSFSDEALDAAAELSFKYINDRRLPDKAIDVIDQAGAVNRLLPDDLRQDELSAKEIEAAVAVMAKIPEKTVSKSEEQSLADLDPALKKVIFGQDAAIETLVAAIKLSRAGLGAPEHPIGSFLFSGPTGVGKTELARQLANVMGVEFVRFDMSEYMEKHTVSRLIGAPPGYVGFDQGGLLTDAIRRSPYAVLLLDEIEKAHPDIFNILLQVMDHATLTDNNGRKADFRHVVLIMTTNAGGRELTASSMGFSRSSETSEERSKESIERVFSPEFRNRLDAWVAFEPLEKDVVVLIVDKMVRELEAQLFDRGVTLELTDAARYWLADEGYDPLFGARPMTRVIQNHIKRPLADRLLFGNLKDGGHVVIDVDDNRLVLEAGGVRSSAPEADDSSPADEPVDELDRPVQPDETDDRGQSDDDGAKTPESEPVLA